MDDLYLIRESREYLKECLKTIAELCGKLKITLNAKKTRIAKLSDGAGFLKGKYRLLPSGKVLRLPHPDGAKRMRRKLKKFKKLIAQGRMNHYDLRTAYQSWRGNFMKRFDADDKVRQMDGLYYRLFFSTGG